MAVLDQIKADWLAARKARETIRATVLGTLYGAIQTRERTFNPARPITEAEVLAEVKKMLDGIIETGKLISGVAGREQQSLDNALERAVLETYMPSQMSEAQIDAFAVESKAAGMNMGAIMAALKAQHPGRYNGQTASMIVKRVLASEG